MQWVKLLTVNLTALDSYDFRICGIVRRYSTTPALQLNSAKPVYQITQNQVLATLFQ